MADADNPGRSGRRLRELGDFEIIEKIGAGAMGAVFKARQKSLDRVVALKVLPPQLAKENPSFIQRFLREARLSASLNHPNIVQGIDVGEDKSLHYFAMEFINGETVGERFERKGKLPEDEVIEIGRQTALALAHAHEKGLVHRDIKPDNLMVTTEGSHEDAGFTVKVMDLGLARAIEDDASMTQSGQAVGTPYYISPEQAKGEKDLDGSCDLYSLGGTLLHMVSGKYPYDGETGAVIMSMHLTAPVPNPRTLMPEMSAELAAVLKKLMAKKPEGRYASGETLAEDLQRMLNGQRPRHVIGLRGGSTSGPLRPIRRSSAAMGTGRRMKVGASGRGETADLDEKTGSRDLKPVGKPFPMIPVAAVAGVLVLGAAIFFATSGDPPKPTKHVKKDTRKDDKAEPKKSVVEVPDPDEVKLSAEELKKKLEALQEKAQKVAREFPRDLVKQENAWGALKAEGRDTPFAVTAEKELAKIDARRKRLARSAVNTLIGEARRKTIAEDYDGALAHLKTLAVGFRNAETGGLLKEGGDEIRKEASRKGERLLTEAEQLFTLKKYEEALKQYQQARAFKYAAIAEKARKKIGQVEAALRKARTEAEAAAVVAFQKVAEAAYKAVEKRDLESAEQVLARGLKDRKLAPKRQSVEALAGGVKSFAELKQVVAKRLSAAGEKGVKLPSERKIYKKLENGRLHFLMTGGKGGGTMPSDENVARTKWPILLQLAGFGGSSLPNELNEFPKPQRVSVAGLVALSGKLDWGRSALAKLKKDAEMAPRVALWEEALVVIEHGAAESLAMGRMSELQGLVQGKKWRKAEPVADELLGEKFGGTEFVKKRKKDILTLRDQVINELAKIDAARVPLSSLVRADVKDLGKGMVELVYDFSRPEQYQDFKSELGKWSVKEGRLVVAPKPNDQLIWLKLPFVGDQLTVQYVGDAPMDLNCILGPEIKKDTCGGYGFRFGRQLNKYSALLDMKAKEISKIKDKLRKGQNNQVKIERKGQVIAGTLNGCEKPISLDAKGSGLMPTRYIALHTWQGAWFDNLVIRGTLDPEWLNKKRKEVFKAKSKPKSDAKTKAEAK